jgi:putative ABC transport system permease protein
MNPGDNIQLSIRNLCQSRLRTTLTCMGVAIGVGALTCMISLGVGMQEQLVGRFLRSGVFDSITVFPSGAQFGRNLRPMVKKNSDLKKTGPEKTKPALDEAALKTLSALDHVKEVYPNLRVPVEVRLEERSEFFTAAGVPMSSGKEGTFQKLSFGSFFSAPDKYECILSLETAGQLSDRLPKELIGLEVTVSFATAGGAGVQALSPALNIQRMEKRFRIVGIIEREAGPSFGGGLFSSIMIPLEKAREMGNYDLSDPQSLLRQLSDKQSFMSATVKVRQPQDVEEVERKISELGYNAFSINDALQGAKKAFILLDLLLGLTGSVALAVASLGIVNTMVMSILERVREIGIMKAIGGSDMDIRKIFLLEASLIGLIGGVCGVILGWAGGRAINFGANIYIKSQGGSPENMFILPWWLITGGILFSIVISLTAGSYPAARAARLDPIQALRHD